jgi:Secretion system C-terminal sorting domain/Cleaved Adhesin Domain
MKKILLTFCLLIYINCNAQIFNQNFDSGSTLATLGWTTIDNDGQTPATQVSYITTGWNTINRFGANGNFGGPAGNYAAMSTSYYIPAGTSDDWLISPTITLPTGASFLIYDAKAKDPIYPDGYQLRISTTAGTTIQDFPTVLLSIPSENSYWTSHNVDLSAYAGQTITLAWVNNSTDNFILLVDNISVVTCAFPINNIITNVESTSATFSWDAITGSSGYEYVIDELATDPTITGNNTNTISFIENALTPNTVYYFHVRNNCGGNSFSAWTTTSFATLAVSPVNDECTGANELIVGTNFATGAQTGTILGANSDSFVSPSCRFNVYNDVWYKVVVPASGSITLETQGTTLNSMTDTVLTAYSGICGSLIEVGCNDNDGIGNMSLLSLTGQTPGDTLYVGVWKSGTVAPNATNDQFQVSAYYVPLANASFKDTTISSYPNPVKNILNLSFNKAISKVVVYNLVGQEVTTKSINASPSQIDMSNLASGTYLVKVTADNQEESIKVIKE